MNRIVKVLMTRDNLTKRQAEIKLKNGRKELQERLENGKPTFNLCATLFGLEPDFLIDLI